MTIKNLILILGDQLTHTLSSLNYGSKESDLVLICEVREETGYVRHHKKKIAFLFSAMRHFAKELRTTGWRVEYISLDDPKNTQYFGGEVACAINHHNPDSLIVTEPGEWRVMEMMRSWQEELEIPVKILPDDRFIATHEEFRSWADDRKQLRMEYFYRDMRRKTRLLMEGDEPEGGKWNFDAENRKPANRNLFMPQPKRFRPDTITSEVIDLVKQEFGDHFGDLEPFWFAVTSDQAKQSLETFLDDALEHFGDYQDAMLGGERFLYHSVLSAYINAGLLDPLETCRAVETRYHQGKIPLNSAEGFIRQIIGWREYVRGIYWLKMPDYVQENFFGATRKLPDFYWTGETKMHCLSEAISQTKEEAYAHHIQRLMVTGNFAMLAGVNPKEVHEWYLMVYADAYEWVELPNTLGMSQFADGGLLGSKPYAASGNYINKMSDYCRDCRFSVSQKTGENACPFNALYWDFLIRNREKLGNNPRLGRVYNNWDRMEEARRKEYLESARIFLSSLD